MRARTTHWARNTGWLALSLAVLTAPGLSPRLASAQPTPPAQPPTQPADAAPQYPIDHSPARPLNLEEALAIARKNNRDLRAARERLRINHTDVERAWAALMPQVSAQLKYTYNNPAVSVDFSGFGALGGVLGTLGNVVADQVATGQYKPSPAIATQLGQLAAQQASLNSLSGAIPPGNLAITPENELDAIFSATLPIIAPSAYPAVSGAKHAYTAAQRNLDVTEAQLLQSVASSFYAAAGADELVAARRNAIDVAQQTLDNARARLEAGVVNRVEVTRAELALIQARQRLLEQEDTRTAAYRVLGTLLDNHDAVKVVPSEESAIDTRSTGELVMEALTLRPEVPNLRETVAANDAQALSNKLRWLPSISAFGNIRLTNANSFSPTRNAFYAAGVQLDWQIFDGFVRDANRHSFEAQAADARLRLSILHDTIADDLDNARRTLITRKEGLHTAQRSVGLAQETLDLVRIQHDAGTATQLDLLTAQDQLVQAQVTLAQARFDMSLAGISLGRLLGTFPGAVK